MTRNTFGFPKRLYKEARHHYRIKENFTINLTTGSDNETIEAKGKIRDLSATGALIESSSMRPVIDGTVLNIEPARSREGAFIPKQGRVVWSKQGGALNQRCFFGIEFLNPPAEALTALTQRIQHRLASLERQESFKEILNTVLFIIFIVLGFMVLRQQGGIFETIQASNRLMLGSARQQAQIYRESLDQYAIQSEVLTNLNNEYNATRALLMETETLLTRSQEQLRSAQQEITGLQQSLSEAQMASLDDQTRVLIQERDALRQELSALQTEISSFGGSLTGWQSAGYQAEMEGLELRTKDLEYANLMARINEHRSDIRLAKQRIHELKKQAAVARKDIQRQQDAIKTAQGNQGFLMRDGKALSATRDASFDSLPASSMPAKPRVNIDVRMAE